MKHSFRLSARAGGRIGWLSAMLWISILGQGSAWAGGMYLVSVGNNRGLEGEPALQYAERDARQIANVLRRFGRVDSRQEILLLGQNADSLRLRLQQISAQIASEQGSGPNRSTLFFYFSGHADAQGLHLGKSALPFEELRRAIAASTAGVRIMIVDACRSGGMTRVKGATPTEDFEIRLDDRTDVEGMAIITSSTAGEDSYESEMLKGSFFSHHLVNGLRGAADNNRDGTITLNEAYAYTYQQTIRSSGQTRSLQHPTYLYDMKGKGELPLTELTNNHPSSGRLVIPDAGIYVIFKDQDDGPVAAEIAVTAKGAYLVLPEGDYVVQKRLSQQYLEYAVGVKGGREIALHEQDSRRIAYAHLLRKGGGGRRSIPGAYVLGGSRGALISGLSAAPHWTLGTSLDFPWLSFGLRGRFSQAGGSALGPSARMNHQELGLGTTAQRFIDFERLSLSLGLLLELTRYSQTVATATETLDRTSYVFGFGALVSGEVRLAGSLMLLLEAGPLTQVFPQATILAGMERGHKTEARLTWCASGGLGWKF